jgi:hypothetical protein
MKRMAGLLLACVFLCGCAYLFGKKEAGADRRPQEGYKREGGYKSMEDLARGGSPDETSFGSK